MSSVSDLNARQRMINMMYLVLLALLALNVSKEILKSFHLMEVSFENAKTSIDDKNAIVMQQFDASMQSNEARTKEWFEKAKEVRKISKDFCDYIDKVKLTIEKNAGGRLPVAQGEAAGTLTELSAPDQMEKHANYFENEKHGKELQDAIEKARKDMIAILNHPKIDKNIPINLDKNSALRAEDPNTKGTNKSNWVSMYLVHSPLAGVTALLSKTESDAKNLEAEVLNVLIKQIDAATIKFDAVEAKIIAPSSYIMSGSQYQAEIVLMALNTTAEPTIFVNGEKIPVEGGKGIYKVPASGAGVHPVKGYIEVEGPDGIEKKEFSTEWQSFQPAATISAEAMNVLYIGLENPISVSVPGFRAEDVVVSAGAGCVLSKTTGTGKYIAKVSRVQGSKTKISASVKMPDGTSRQMGMMEYRIREVPNPEPMYGTLTSGAQGKGALMAQSTLNASLGAGFAFEGVRFIVTKYSALLVPRVGNARPVTVNGSSLANVNSLVSSAKAGDKLIIANVECKGPGGIQKKLTASLVIDIK
ncbi:MAG: gliding motility protein GldM [Bacteroidia bacterium]|nr:gliding motility protein GldM [Bacteroidia bacterium]